MDQQVQRKRLEQDLAKIWDHIPSYESNEEARTDHACLAAQVEELTSQLSSLNCMESQVSNNAENASERLQNFIVNNGGLTGGWRSDDHALFLRLLATHSPAGASLVSELAKLTGKSSQAIEDHLHWYRRYCGLRRGQKAEVEAWKKKYEQEKTKGRGQAKQELKDIQRRNSESVKTWLAYWHEERLIRKQEVEKWKRAKFELMKQREEEQNARRTKQLEQERLSTKEKAERALLCHFSRKKRLEDAAIAEKTQHFMTSLQKWERSRSANAKVKQLSRRDVDKAAAKAQERARTASASPELRVSAKVNGARDPTRLLLPTQAFLHHQIATEPTLLWKPPLLWKEMPRRSTPSWRRLLS